MDTELVVGLVIAANFAVLLLISLPVIKKVTFGV